MSVASFLAVDELPLLLVSVQISRCSRREGHSILNALVDNLLDDVQKRFTMQKKFANSWVIITSDRAILCDMGHVFVDGFCQGSK